MISSVLSWIGWTLLLLVAYVVSRVVVNVLRYALVSRFKNAALRRSAPSTHALGSLTGMFGAGPIAFLDSLEAMSKAKQTTPPLVLVGASREGGQVVAVCGADGLKDVFTKTNVFAKDRELGDALKPILGVGLTRLEGDEWFRERRLLTPLFHLNLLKSYNGIMNEEARNLVDEIAALKGAPVLDAPRLFGKTALTVIARAIFGDRLDVARVRDLWQQATDGLIPFVGWATLFPQKLVESAGVGKVGKMFAALREMDAMFSRLVEDVRATKRGADEPTPVDLLAQIALLRDDEDESKWALSAYRAVSEAKTFSFAAQDTTSNLLSWASFHLAGRPDLQQALIDESVAHVGLDADVPEPDRLKLHRAVLNESLRLTPPVPFVTRTVVEPTELYGQPVEAGTQILAFILASHLNAEHFPDPRAFRPERWLDQSTAERHAFSFLPFVAGGRACIGQKLALQEATIILSHLVRRFKIHVDNPTEVKFLSLHGTAEPAHMRVRFEARV